MKLEASTLGEICDRGRGEVKTGPFGSQLHQSDYVDDGVPVVMPKNISAGKVDTSDIARIRESDVARLSQHCLSVGDIVYGRRGEIGRHAFISSREKGWLCGTGCLRITPGPSSEVVPRYLHYFLDVPDTISWIANQAIGATMPNLNTSILRSVPIAYPSVQTQNKIAAVLSDYDDLIENNLRRIRILEEMARSLYREWFVGFRFPGHERVRFVESPLGKIPEGWEVKRTSDAFEFCGGATPSTGEPTYWEDGTVVWYSPSDLTKANTVFMYEGERKITEAGLASCSSRLFPAYSVMMTSRATLGVLGINTTPACTNQGFITCIPNQRVSCPHLFLWLDASREKLEQLGTGATFKEITKRAFRDVLILLPPEGIERAFHDLVWPEFLLVENLIGKNRALRNTRDLLLPLLISGDLDVSNLDIAVPEAVA